LYKLDVQGTSNTVGIRAASNTANDILYYATGTVTGNINAFTSSINATGILNLSLENNNTSTGSSRFNVQVPSASSGDPYLLLTTSGATNWVVGIDNSDADKLKIGPVSDPSNGANTIVATTGGNVLIGTTTDNGQRLQVNGDIALTAGDILLQNNRSLSFGGTTEKITGSTGSNSLSLLTNNTTRLFIDVSGNVGIPQTSFGTSATRTLAISSGTAPTTSPADAFQLYSNDIVAGNAAPHIRTENGAVLKMYQETTGVAAATLVSNAGTAITSTDTFDGYTLRQIVKALRNQGLLA